MSAIRCEHLSIGKSSGDRYRKRFWTEGINLSGSEGTASLTVAPSQATRLSSSVIIYAMRDK
jgi:hypothetical protein